MKIGALKKNCTIASMIFCMSLFPACAIQNRNVPSSSFRTVQNVVINEEFQLSDDGPKLKLVHSNGKYLYQMSYRGRSAEIESHIQENPSTGAPASLEVTSSNDFKDIVIKEDLTDAAPAVFFIYINLDSDGSYRNAYWRLPVCRFDSSTPLGVEFPLVESVDGGRVTLYYKVSSQRKIVDVDDIESSVLPVQR